MGIGVERGGWPRESKEKDGREDIELCSNLPR